MPFINLTPHDITFMGNEITGNTWGEFTQTVTYPASGTVARVCSSQEEAGVIDGVRTIRQTFGDVTGIPDTRQDVLYIVSALVFGATNRTDVICPADFVRNDAGQVIGCRAFQVK